MTKSTRSPNLFAIVKEIAQLPKTTGPKKLFNCLKQQTQKEILFLPYKKKEELEEITTY